MAKILDPSSRKVYPSDKCNAQSPLKSTSKTLRGSVNQVCPQRSLLQIANHNHSTFPSGHTYRAHCLAAIERIVIGTLY